MLFIKLKNKQNKLIYYFGIYMYTYMHIYMYMYIYTYKIGNLSKSK